MTHQSKRYMKNGMGGKPQPIPVAEGKRRSLSHTDGVPDEGDWVDPVPLPVVLY